MKRQILISSIILLFVAGFATAKTIHVPGAYPYIDIQQAINRANLGDVIVIAPGTYIGTGYNINKGITITGTDPNNPYVVAATVIDFDGQDELAFNLSGFAPIVLRGITIANSWRWWVPVSDGVNPGDNGFDSHDWYGGTGINISGNHIVSNCIIRNCRFEGGPGGNGAAGGANGYPGDPIAVPINYGGNGGRGGHRYGTGIYIASGSPQILNTEISDCVAIGGPGGAGGAGLDAAPPDPNIRGGRGGNGGNGGNAMGAGVYCASLSSPIFRNCIIRNCEVRAGDAADGNDGGDGIIEDVNLLFPGGPGGHGGVPGFARGAGVYCDSGVNATFTDCQFIGNRAYGANGGDGGDAGDVHLAMPWLAGGIGGLVEQSYSQSGTPQGGNPPSDYSALGAGVYIEHNAAATFTGCTFGDNVTRCSVSGLGGWPSNGIREHPRKNFPIPSYGAGVYCDDFTTTTFTDCNVQGNWTTQEPNQYQGDLYPYGSGEINPDFQYAEADYIGYGGGMCLIGGALGTNFGYVELNHCNISDNNAPVGGGVCASALTDFHVDDCNFVNNSAYLGAGLFSIDNFSSISRSNFSGNRADDPDIYGSGGGLFCFSTDVFISDCIFSENTTNGYGAGIYMAGEVAIPPLTAEPVLKNCLFADNKAGLDGGGIYCDWYTKPNIINCTITGNEARGDPPFGVGYGGGLYCSYGSDVNIINSIVWGNAGPNTIGPEMAIETWFGFDPTILTVSYCDVEGGEEEVWVDDYSTLNWGTGNIDDDPLFVGGYHLSQTEAGQMADSPCVDAGSDLASAFGLDTYTTRVDGVPDQAFPAFAVDGFGGSATGGAGGPTVTVSTAANFKTYVESTSPYIVLVSGAIDLGSVGGGVKIKSNKTISCATPGATIIGRLGFPQTAPYSSNIIIKRLNITNPSYSEADGISVKKYVTNLLITHCTIYDCGDGCIDITNASDYVTVSWCKFYYSNPAPVESHRFVNLFSASDDATEDRGKLHITFHHNWWASRCDQRMPRGRFGQVHVYNNYYSCTGNLYCIGVGVESQLRVENNYFDGVNQAWSDLNTFGYIPGIIGWNSDNQFMNGTTIPMWATNDYATIFTPSYSYTLDAGADVKSIVMAGAGADGGTTGVGDRVDMGYHYPGATVTVTSCDFDGDGDVDLADLGILVSYWLEQNCGLPDWCEGTDLNTDTDVDFVDYAIFAQAYHAVSEGPPPLPDTDPPEPDPSEWAIEPHPLSSSAIHMVATTAYDPSGGVQYQFECVGGGGHSTDWQSSPEYTDTGLDALTEYTYEVRTCDVHENKGGYSVPRSATTLP